MVRGFDGSVDAVCGIVLYEVTGERIGRVQWESSPRIRGTPQHRCELKPLIQSR
jgi:hypothetical protein